MADAPGLRYYKPDSVRCTTALKENFKIEVYLNILPNNDQIVTPIMPKTKYNLLF